MKSELVSQFKSEKGNGDRQRGVDHGRDQLLPMLTPSQEESYLYTLNRLLVPRSTVVKCSGK